MGPENLGPVLLVILFPTSATKQNWYLAMANYLADFSDVMTIEVKYPTIIFVVLGTLI